MTGYEGVDFQLFNGSNFEWELPYIKRVQHLIEEMNILGLGRWGAPRSPGAWLISTTEPTTSNLRNLNSRLEAYDAEVTWIKWDGDEIDLPSWMLAIFLGPGDGVPPEVPESDWFAKPEHVISVGADIGFELYETPMKV